MKQREQLDAKAKNALQSATETALKMQSSTVEPSTSNNRNAKLNTKKQKSVGKALKQQQ